MDDLKFSYYKQLLKTLREKYWEKLNNSFIKINAKNYKNYLRVIKKEKWLFFFNFSITLRPIESNYSIIDTSNYNINKIKSIQVYSENDYNFSLINNQTYNEINKEYQDKYKEIIYRFTEESGINDLNGLVNLFNNEIKFELIKKST
jgi:hypothetical protein